MAYSTAQKNAVERQDIKDSFRLGHRQWQSGVYVNVNGSGGNDAVTVYFSSWWKKSQHKAAYDYMTNSLGRIFGRIDKQLVLVSSPDKAFLECYAPSEIDSSNPGVAGRVTSYTNYNGTGKYKKLLYIRKDYATGVAYNFSTTARLGKFIMRHENLHVLGFEHPFANDDGDFDLNLTVLDTDLDYPNTQQKMDWINNNTVRDGRLAGQLDRVVMSERMKPQYN